MAKKNSAYGNTTNIPTTRTAYTVLLFSVCAFRMQLDMLTVQGAFLDKVGASEALLQLPEHMKLNPHSCGWISPLLETKIRGLCLIGDRGAQHLHAAAVAVLLLLVDGPPGRG